jgi:uncharacterized membrane protein required for colicin V production
LNYVDFVFLGVVVLTVLFGLRNGLGKEIVTTISWALVYALLFAFGTLAVKTAFSVNAIKDLFMKIFPTGALNNAACAFLVLALLIVKLVVIVIRKIPEAIFRIGRYALTLRSRIAGMLMGFFKSAAYLLLLYLIMRSLTAFEFLSNITPYIESSAFYKLIDDIIGQPITNIIGNGLAGIIIS